MTSLRKGGPGRREESSNAEGANRGEGTRGGAGSIVAGNPESSCMQEPKEGGCLKNRARGRGLTHWKHGQRGRKRQLSKDIQMDKKHAKMFIFTDNQRPGNKAMCFHCL